MVGEEGGGGGIVRGGEGDTREPFEEDGKVTVWETLEADDTGCCTNCVRARKGQRDASAWCEKRERTFEQILDGRFVVLVGGSTLGLYQLDRLASSIVVVVVVVIARWRGNEERVAFL